MDVPPAGRLPIDLVQEGKELGVGVARLAALDHMPLEDIQRRKQRGRAVPLVIVRLPRRHPWPQGQDRLRAIEGLNLALLIDAQHQRLRGRIQIEADDVPQLAHEVRIAAELEGLRPMGLQIVPLARSDAPSPDSRVDACANVRTLQCVASRGRRVQRRIHDRFDLLRAESAFGAPAAAHPSAGRPRPPRIPLPPQQQGRATDPELLGQRMFACPRPPPTRSAPAAPPAAASCRLDQGLQPLAILWTDAQRGRGFPHDGHDNMIELIVTIYQRQDTSVVWLKFAALAEGARLATRQLWGRAR